MKKMVSFLIAMSAVSTVYAQNTGSGFDALSEYGNRYATLEHCGGTATLTEVYSGGTRRPMLQIRNVERCSNIVVNNDRSEKINNGAADVVIYERSGMNINEVTLESNSRKTSDTVRVKSFGEKAPTRSSSANIVYSFGVFSSMLGASKVASLPTCGGTAQVTVTNGDNITVVFRDVENCSKFDIMGANGYTVDYPVKPLQRDSRGNFGGSFTIPSRFITYGGNGIKVTVRSNSGKTDEVMLIQFANF